MKGLDVNTGSLLATRSLSASVLTPTAEICGLLLVATEGLLQAVDLTGLLGASTSNRDTTLTIEGAPISPVAVSDRGAAVLSVQGNDLVLNTFDLTGHSLQCGRQVRLGSIGTRLLHGLAAHDGGWLVGTPDGALTLLLADGTNLAARLLGGLATLPFVQLARSVVLAANDGATYRIRRVGQSLQTEGLIAPSLSCTAMAATASHVVACAGATVRAADLATGAVHGETLEQTIYANPALLDGTVIVAGHEGTLYEFDIATMHVRTAMRVALGGEPQHLAATPERLVVFSSAQAVALCLGKGNP